jgi:hypothetical protein
LDRKVEKLEGEKRQLKAVLFGRRTKATTRGKRSNHLDDPQVGSQEPQRKWGQQPENTGPKRRDYSDLPVRTNVSELAPEQCMCPTCGERFLPHGYAEDSDRDRSFCLASSNSSAALLTNLYLRWPERRHSAARPQADPERAIWHLGVSRNPPGQVLQLLPYRTPDGLVAAVGFGLGSEHHHQRFAAVGGLTEADLRSPPKVEPAGRYAPSRGDALAGVDHLGGQGGIRLVVMGLMEPRHRYLPAESQPKSHGSRKPLSSQLTRGLGSCMFFSL